MAVRQINTADYDYSMFLETLNKSYKGKSDITLSEYNTTAAPDVKVGSVWEDNGAIFILESADLEPTGYAGIANSTTFYCYYDESAEVFIYSSTVPVWNDALQGWYTGNDRAFFSMYKDSGGTLYEQKSELGKQKITGDNIEAITINKSIIFPAFGEIGSLVTAASSAHSGAASTVYLANTTQLGSTLYYSSSTPAGGAALGGSDAAILSVSSGAWTTYGLTGTWRLLSRVAKGTNPIFYPIGLWQRII